VAGCGEHSNGALIYERPRISYFVIDVLQIRVVMSTMVSTCNLSRK
jgi:hypothetical protein